MQVKPPWPIYYPNISMQGWYWKQFADNPFLPKFYENPQQYAFPLELFFMAERFKQLKELIQQKIFFKTSPSPIICLQNACCLPRSICRKMNLGFTRDCLKLCHQQLVQPDILIYLHAPVNKLQQNIKKRNRSYEQNIPDDYLVQHTGNLYALHQAAQYQNTFCGCLQCRFPRK